MSTIACDSPDCAPPVKARQAIAGTEERGQSSYGQILKSTAWVGGSSVLNILISIVRTKVMAVLLGPAGFGLAGLYITVSSLVQNFAELGVNSSGVRQIAESVGSGDRQRIARTAAVLRWVSLALGIFGALLLIALALPISRITFGTDQRWIGVSMLSLAVFFTLVSAGQGALIQGMRRISDLAKMGVLGALFASMAAIPLVYFFREDGVAPSLVVAAAMTLLVSWWYSRKIDVERPSITVREIRHETAALIRLGIAFMISNLLMMVSAYVVRIIVRQEAGLTATGFYHAAWTMGGLYVGMILQSMGADFYPRLTAAIHDHDECNRLVNEQARVSVLLAGPGVIATLALAPLVLSLMYAADFGGATGVLRWICLGIAMRVVSWPMGFIIMAKARQNLIIVCEASWTICHLGLAWILVGRFGVAGAGVAFFLSYLFHIVLTYTIVQKLTGFRWTTENIATIALYIASVAAVFSGCLWLPTQLSTLFGIVIAALLGGYAMKTLLKVVPRNQIPRPLSQFLARIGMVTAEADSIS